MERKKERILTGDRPTGFLHIGHYVGSLKKRVENQDKYETFIMIANTQALTDHADQVHLVQENILEVLLDYLSVGIDPKKSHIFLQSEIPALFEITAYLLNCVSIARIGHNPTVKQEIKQKNFEKSTPAGFYLYPAFQAADILAFKPSFVPVGFDQAPMLELTRDIVKKFNAMYHKEVFKVPTGMFPTNFKGNLKGIDGNKMSKSLGNAIYLKDSRDEIAKKVRKMPSDPDRTDYKMPGNPEKVLAFDYLQIFDPDQAGLRALMQDYRGGGVMDKKVKERLIEVLDTFLTPIRQKRQNLQNDVSHVLGILREGTAYAREFAHSTLSEMKKVMGLAPIF